MAQIMVAATQERIEPKRTLLTNTDASLLHKRNRGRYIIGVTGVKSTNLYFANPSTLFSLPRAGMAASWTAAGKLLARPRHYCDLIWLSAGQSDSLNAAIGKQSAGRGDNGRFEPTPESRRLGSSDSRSQGRRQLAKSSGQQTCEGFGLSLCSSLSPTVNPAFLPLGQAKGLLP